MRIFSYTLLIIGALLFSSCEDVVQIKLDEGSKIYVIDAFINNLQTDQVVRITTNDSYFSNRIPPAVPGAKVLLTDLTANKQFQFDYTGDGNYVYKLNPADTLGKLNHQYKLEVTVDGYLYTSMAVQKRTAVIDSISVLPNNGGGFGPPSTDTTFFCFLYARDKADNNPDYYWVKTYRNDTLFAASSDINITVDGTGGAVYDAPTDSVEFTPPSTFLSFKTYRKNDQVKVEIHSLSKDNYYFFIQAFNQINNAGLFATTPENIKTNIVTPSDAKTKAIGRFNMATVSVKTRIVK